MSYRHFLVDFDTAMNLEYDKTKTVQDLHVVKSLFQPSHEDIEELLTDALCSGTVYINSIKEIDIKTLKDSIVRTYEFNPIDKIKNIMRKLMPYEIFEAQEELNEFFYYKDFYATINQLIAVKDKKEAFDRLQNNIELKSKQIQGLKKLGFSIVIHSRYRVSILDFNRKTQNGIHYGCMLNGNTLNSSGYIIPSDDELNAIRNILGLPHEK